MRHTARIATWLFCLAALFPAGLARAQTPAEIPVALASTSLVVAAPRVAKELGLFDKYSLAPKFIIMDSANAATAALIAGSVRFAVAGPGEAVPAMARGQNVVTLANLYGGLGASLALAKPVAEKTGVAANAPALARLKALDGMLIASPSATSSYTVALRSAAKAAGITLRFTYMAQPAMPAALESGAIQGFFTSAPTWAGPVLKGSGVIWLSGPRGELGADATPVSSAGMQTMRDYAQANPALMKNVAAVFADLGEAIRTRPADVKAAVARLYPDLDAATLDLLFASESQAWAKPPLTAADMAHDLAFVKASGAPIPNVDSVNPAALLFP